MHSTPPVPFQPMGVRLSAMRSVRHRWSNRLPQKLPSKQKESLFNVFSDNYKRLFKEIRSKWLRNDVSMQSASLSSTCRREHGKSTNRLSISICEHAYMLGPWKGLIRKELTLTIQCSCITHHGSTGAYALAVRPGSGAGLSICTQLHLHQVPCQGGHSPHTSPAWPAQAEGTEALARWG